MVETIISQLHNLSHTLPLEIFIFVGTIVEELIGPIPSPIILITAGSIAKTQQYHLLYILILSFIASSAKTLISCLFYYLADKAENLIFHRDFEKIRDYFDGSKKDDILIFFARAIPFLPTALVSVACGFIKLDFTSFVRATFFGFAFRSFIFVYLGYFGITSYQNWQKGEWQIPYLQIALFLAIIIFLILGFFAAKHLLSSHQKNSKR